MTCWMNFDSLQSILNWQQIELGRKRNIFWQQTNKPSCLVLRLLLPWLGSTHRPNSRIGGPERDHSGSPAGHMMITTSLQLHFKPGVSSTDLMLSDHSAKANALSIQSVMPFPLKGYVFMNVSMYVRIYLFIHLFIHPSVPSFLHSLHTHSTHQGMQLRLRSILQNTPRKKVAEHTTQYMYGQNTVYVHFEYCTIVQHVFKIIIQ